MAQRNSQLSDAQISKVTDIISGDHGFRFCVEYLRIDRNKYKTIEYDAKFIHHDILFECIKLWKNKTEGEGLNAKQEVIKLLTKVQEEQGWFSKLDMIFLFDGEPVTISTERK